MSHRPAVFGCTLLSLLVACAGQAGQVDCTFEACGGDPTGTWTVAMTCVDPGDSPPWCPELTYNAVEVEAIGTLTFAPDGTYTENLTHHSILMTTTIPAFCLGESACSDRGDQATTCTEDPDGGCACTTYLEDEPSEPFVDTWSVENTTLLAGAPREFCVDRDVLKIRSGFRANGELLLVLTR